MPRARKGGARRNGRTRDEVDDDPWSKPFEYAKDGDDYDPYAARRAALEQRIAAFVQRDTDKQDARRRVEWSLGERWESAIWNEWRAERGLDPLPDPAPLFYAWEVAFAGFTMEQAPGGLWGDEA